MALNVKSLDFSIKAVDEEQGTFTAYGNTFGNVDHAGDKTMKGAFKNCIDSCNAKGRMPRLLSQHGHRQNPIGIITSMKEDEHGLLFEGKFCLEPGTAGAEAYALVKMGALDMFSIGYKTIKEKTVHGVNELHELDVKEISLVTFACNENSLIQSVKSAIDAGESPTTRMIQKSLQEAGLSKRQAEAAVNAIKSAGDAEQSGKTALDSFLSRKEQHSLSTDNLSIKSDMSLSEYARMISEAVNKTIEGDEVYSYTKEIYMDYAILAVYDYSEDEYKEYCVKVSYTVKDDTDVQVGTPVEVFKDVQWLTADELSARKSAGVKSTEPNVTNEVTDVKETDILGELASTDVSGWFK